MQDNALLNKLLIFANKFSSQRHITAIRDGFVALYSIDDYRFILGTDQQSDLKSSEWSFEKCCWGCSLDGFRWSSL